MVRSSPGKTIILFISLLATVVILSMVSARLWGGKPEKLPNLSSLVVSQEMTLKEFGQVNGLPNPSLKSIFGLQNKSDLQKTLSQFGTDTQNRFYQLLRPDQTSTVVHSTKSRIAIKIQN